MLTNAIPKEVNLGMCVGKESMFFSELFEGFMAFLKVFCNLIFFKDFFFIWLKNYQKLKYFCIVKNL